MSVFKVFVINLDKSVARLERLKAEFERIGLDFERIPAVDGRKLSENQILKHYSPELNRKKYFVPLSKPEIGLYMSHLKACERIISENLDFGIILEDDIVLRQRLWNGGKKRGQRERKMFYNARCVNKGL